MQRFITVQSDCGCFVTGGTSVPSYIDTHTHARTPVCAHTDACTYVAQETSWNIGKNSAFLRKQLYF